METVEFLEFNKQLVDNTLQAFVNKHSKNMFISDKYITITPKKVEIPIYKLSNFHIIEFGYFNVSIFSKYSDKKYANRVIGRYISEIWRMLKQEMIKQYFYLLHEQYLYTLHTIKKQTHSYDVQKHYDKKRGLGYLHNFSLRLKIIKRFEERPPRNKEERKVS